MSSMSPGTEIHVGDASDDIAMENNLLDEKN